MQTPIEAPLSRGERHWLHAKLSGFYALYYMVLGAVLPYWALYLDQRGFSPSQIGIAIASIGLVRIVAPVIWGWVMDHSQRRLQMIAVAMLFSGLLFGLIPFSSSFAGLVALHVAYAIFWNAALPAFEVVTLNQLARTGLDYARIRLWGSVGFIAAVAVLGPLFEVVDLELLPWIVVAMMLVMAGLATRVPDRRDLRPHAQDAQGLWQVLRRPAVIALFVCCFCSQLSFAPFYTFFSLFLEQHDYQRGVIGVLWALGVLAEVVVFLITGRLIDRFGPRRVLIFALVTTVVRWLMLAALVESVLWVGVGQLLHFSSFGLYHAVTVHFVYQMFPGRLQGRGQALLVACSFGLGGAIGSSLGGYVWEGIGAEAVYHLAAAVAAVGVVAAYLTPRDEQLPTFKSADAATPGADL